VHEPIPDWKLDDFLVALDRWVEIEKIADDTALLVLDWVMGRHEDPYQGMRRVDGFDNLWFGRVPGTEDGRGQAVACSYWIVESERRVRCDSFATLSLPF
jgi:hypothetical protein